MRRWSLSAAIALVSAATMLNLVTPRPAAAFIHEIIAAMCRAGGEEVVPPGQVKVGNSFVRALMATGFITSIEETATQTIIHFDPTIPASKFKSAGFNLTIPRDPNVPDSKDLVLMPLVIPDPDFAAHNNCHNLNP